MPERSSNLEDCCAAIIIHRFQCKTFKVLRAQKLFCTSNTKICADKKMLVLVLTARNFKFYFSVSSAKHFFEHTKPLTFYVLCLE